MHKHRRYLQIFTIAVVLLMGYTGYAMVLPILTPLLISTDTLLDPTISESTRYILVGALIACFEEIRQKEVLLREIQLKIISFQKS